MTAAPKLFTQAELDSKVLEANLYLGENLHEAFTSDDVTEAVELLQLKEHERPTGLVSSLGNAFVHVPEKLARALAHNPSIRDVRAACVLLLTECAAAEEERERQAREAAGEMNGAGAVQP